ncbi:MAG TPA: transglutaminase-like domain-containing protein, partial [Puia sp.]
MKCSAAYLLLAGLICLSSSLLRAQSARPDMTFGSVTAESWAAGTDSSAAIILFDHGEIRYDDSYHAGRLGVVYERHTRILLLRHDALRLASLTLSNARKGDALIDEFKGATYNLENGSVAVTRLDKSNIFTEKNAEAEIEKVAFPNAKEGSIIEYRYRILYPGINFIPTWRFQGMYPERWSEYDISVPRFYDFAVRFQGHQKFVLDSTIVYDGNGTPIIRRIWALQDVPPLEKAEPYTTTIKNHLSLIEFQLASVQHNGIATTYSTTWPQLIHELLKNDNFGAGLDDHNRWMDDEVKRITAGAGGPAEALRRIYAYVRDQFSCTQAERIYLSQPIRKTWDEKRGASIADLNLLLTALCRHQGWNAAPVILSSRANGYAHDGYPLVSEYNYVIARVLLDGKQYLLDASKPYLGFGQLPELCYNGWGRAIDSTHDRIALFPDSIRESRRTVVVLANSDSGYTGTYTRRAGTFESMNLRNQLKKASPEAFFENL